MTDPSVLYNLPATQVLHALQDPAWLATPDGGAYVYNQRLVQVFPVALLSAEEQQQALHPDEKAQLQSQFQQGLNGQEAFSITFRAQDASQGYAWHQVTITPLKDQDRITAWLGIVRMLEETSEYLQAILDHVPVGISVLDTNLRFRLINPTAAAGSRYTPNQYLGEALEHLFQRLTNRSNP